MTNNQKTIWRAQSCNFLTLKTYPKFIRIRSLKRPQRPSFTFHPCWGQKHILPPIPVKGAARVNPDGLKYMSWHGPSPHRQKKKFTLKYSFVTGKTTLTPPLKVIIKKSNNHIQIPYNFENSFMKLQNNLEKGKFYCKM